MIKKKEHPTAFQLAAKAGVPLREFTPPEGFGYPCGDKKPPPDAPYVEPPTWSEVLAAREEVP